MIIILSVNDTNVKGARLLMQQYAINTYHTEISDLLSERDNEKIEKLFIVDLPNESQLGRVKKPELFAQELIAWGLPPNLSDIYLLISDQNKGFCLSVFAKSLSALLQANLNREVIVHAPSLLGHSVSLEPSGKWRIRGMDQQTLWEDQDIVSYLDDPQRSFSPAPASSPNFRSINL